jgi:phosphatidylserine/phosphatidylglycerophosphate/cardiolipin synthase-like enzyme
MSRALRSTRERRPGTANGVSARAWASWWVIVSLGLCGCSTYTGTGGGGTTVRSNGLSLVTEPGPGDGPFIALIDSARRSIQVTIYELSDERVEQALAAAAARGVRVGVLLDDGQYGAGRALNDAAYRYMATHGVSVAWAPGYFALTHQKSIVIDRRVAAIMTLNLTPVYYASSRDFAVLDYRPADVAQVAQTFDADLRRRQLTPGMGSGDLVWSPGAQAPIGALIAHARRSLQVESEEMDDPAITSELCQAVRRGVRLQVVMTYQAAWRAALDYLADCGAQVRTYPESGALYIHAKLIRADGRTVFIGSQNFSRQSLTYNRELGIITHNPQIAASTGDTFSADFAAGQPYSP